MTKPTVHYVEMAQVPGGGAAVKCIDHPHLAVQVDGFQHGFTSKVISGPDADGTFETNNSIYKKAS